MPNRFGKTTFNTVPRNNNRRPILSSEAPTESPVENPDPGGPGGSGITGTDIGSPTGFGTQTPVMPTITRKNHGERIFVQRGETMSITYVIDGPGTMLAKWGYEDMTETYTPDGRELTLSWTCPIDEPSDSLPIGVEVWVTRGEVVFEDYQVLWDTLHVAKQPSDIIDADPILTVEENIAQITNPNATMIFDDTQVRDRDGDFIAIGSNEAGQPLQLNRPVNGTTTTVGTGIDRQIVVDTNVVIMTKTPLQTKLDRKYRRGGIIAAGNREEGNSLNSSGGRETKAIKVKGFFLKNAIRANISTNRAEKVAIDGCEHVQDATIGQTTVDWAGDGDSLAHICSGNCSMEYTGTIANERLLNNFGFNFNAAAYKCSMSKNLSTQACVQLRDEDIAQDFTFYGARFCRLKNTLAVDDFLFVPGWPDRFTIANLNYVCTNSANEGIKLNRCGGINSAKRFWRNDEGDGVAGAELEHCVAWRRRESPISDSDTSISRGTNTFTNCFVGNQQNIFFSSTFADVNTNTINNQMVVNPNWNFGESDLVISGNSNPTINGFGVVNPPEEISNIITGSDSYFSYSTAESAGLKYITRREFAGSAENNNLGVSNFFAAVGRYGRFEDDDDQDVYDGTGGRPYVNWITRSPWYEKRAARQEYQHVTSNGFVYTGFVGINGEGVHPVDYLNRFGLSPTAPIVTPHIEDIYLTLEGSTVRLFWRPICAAFSATNEGYDVYVDGIRIAENQSILNTQFTIEGIASGLRYIWIVVRDSTYGDSGHSRVLTVTIP